MQVLDSAVEEPANRIGATGAAWRLDANGSYRAASEIYFDRPPVNRSGSWTSLSKGFVLTGEPTTYFSTLSCGGSVYHNLDCDFRDRWCSAVGSNPDTIVRLGVVQTGSDVWRIAISNEVYTYADDSNLVLDPEKSVAFRW